MRSIRSVPILACLLLLALPTQAAETITVTIDADSPRPLGTGLVASSGDYFLVNAVGAARVVTNFPITQGWFDASGLGRLRRGGQVFGDMPYGGLIGTFGPLGAGFTVGDIAVWNTQPVDVGDEFQVGLNMSAADQSTMEGSFQVHVTRFTDDDVVSTTVRINPNSPRPLGTGIVATSTNQDFLVLAQGTTRVLTSGLIIEGWHDPSGLGRLRRTGQIFSDMPYASVIGTFTGSLGGGFYVGDIATWGVQTADVGDEFEVGLNMDADDQLGMDGFFMVHVVRISNLVVTAVDADREVLPDRNSFVKVDSYPNPFNPLTTIRFVLARQQSIRAAVTNLDGEHLVDLAAGTYSAGTHELTWDGCDAQRRPVASGTYLVRLETDTGLQVQKVALVR